METNTQLTQVNIYSKPKVIFSMKLEKRYLENHVIRPCFCSDHQLSVLREVLMTACAEWIAGLNEFCLLRSNYNGFVQQMALWDRSSHRKGHFHSITKDLKNLPHIQRGLLESCRERGSAKAESFCQSNCILVYASTVSVPFYLTQAGLREWYLFIFLERENDALAPIIVQIYVCKRVPVYVPVLSEWAC